MAKHGITPEGVNIKRLDEISDSMHARLSERWGVNTKQNPESFLAHILLNISDAVAELWEFGEDIYHSMYPSSAEGVSLDNAAQYGGATREAAAKSYYPIHCTGKEGTILAAGTLISSALNPPTQLSITEAKTISRSSFNRVGIKVASVEPLQTYTVAVDGTVFSFGTNDNPSVSDVLEGLQNVIKSEDFIAKVDYENEMLNIETVELVSNHALILSENLHTDTVTTVITFGTIETGDIQLPDGTITNIVKADAGLLNVVNMSGYIAGRDEESDPEFRQSYADKIFNRSSMMLESIKSAILENVQGVKSVAPYENPSHEWDAYGRPPHSIEIVVDGGDATEIAKQILNKKAGGINTFGSTEVTIKGKYDEDILIRFNRPAVVYTWFRIGITLRKNEPLPPNYVELLREVVLNNMDQLEAGSDIIPQEFTSDLYRACSGISYADLSIFCTTDKAEEPVSYPLRSAEITARQRAYTSEEMIEVVIDG